MDLQTFITQTLNQILAGVAAAQEKEGGDKINARLLGQDLGGHLIAGMPGEMFTKVDFDIAVTAETTGGGKGSVKVFSVGVEGGGEHRHEHVSRISFSVPILLPGGEQ